MNANLTLNRVWPLVLLLAAIALVMHASQAAGEPPYARSPVTTLEKSRCSTETWCNGCLAPRTCHCDDYCPKPAPCVHLPKWCWLCPDYGVKCPPSAPCRVRALCFDDYCPKPCPKCPDGPRCTTAMK